MSIHLVQQGIREGVHSLMLEADQIVNYLLLDQDGEPVDITAPAVAELRLYPTNDRFGTPAAYFDLTVVAGPAGAGLVAFPDTNDQDLEAQTYYGWLYHTDAPAAVDSLTVLASSVTITVHPIFSSTARHGSGLDIDMSVAAVSVPSIANGGTGYVQGDILTHNDVGGSAVLGDLATFLVDAVDGSGVITAISVLNPGEYSAIVSADSLANAPTGGTGAGASINIYWTGLTPTLTSGGSGYSDTPVIAVENAPGMAISAVLGALTRLITDSPVQLTFK